MSDKLTLHIIHRGELRAGTCYDRFDDPDQIAPLGDPKLRTMLDNPLAGDDDEPAQIIGLSGNRVIGRTDLIAGRISVDGEPQRIFWSSHLYVPPEYRNTLMGVMLILKAQSVSPFTGAFGPSQAALPVYQKLKWIDLPFNRHILIVRSRPVVERYISGAIAAPLSIITDAALRLHRLLVTAWRAVAARGLRVERVAIPPPELADYFRARAEPIQVHRSPEFLKWQLEHHFRDDARDRSELFVVRDRRGRIAGYFMNKVRFHETATHRGFKNVLLGSPQDWAVIDPVALDTRTLLMLAVRELVARGVHAVDFCTADASLGTPLKLLGFKAMGALHLMVKSPPASRLIEPEYRDLSRWWIRPGDGDNFFV